MYEQMCLHLIWFPLLRVRKFAATAAAIAAVDCWTALNYVSATGVVALLNLLLGCSCQG